MLLSDASLRVVHIDGLSLPSGIRGWSRTGTHHSHDNLLIQGVLQAVHKYYVIDIRVGGRGNETSFDAYDFKTRKKFFRCHGTLPEGSKLSKSLLGRVGILEGFLEDGQEVRVRIRDGDCAVGGEGAKIVLGPGLRVASTKIGEDKDDLVPIPWELTRVGRNIKLKFALKVLIV